MKVGMTATCTRIYTEEDRLLYLQLTGDSESAAGSKKHRLPEPLIGSLFSFLLGTELPGFGTNYLKQRMNFSGSGFYGEELTATVVITRLRPDKNLVNLETRCTNSRGETICRGEALVLAKDVAPHN